MPAVGGDLQDLQRLVNTFNQQAGQALTIKSVVSSGVENAIWTGPNATKFRAAWTAYSKNLDTLKHAFEEAAIDVRKQADALAQATGSSV